MLAVFFTATAHYCSHISAYCVPRSRVDRLNDGDGKLDTAELVNALGLVGAVKEV